MRFIVLSVCRKRINEQNTLKNIKKMLTDGNSRVTVS